MARDLKIGAEAKPAIVKELSAGIAARRFTGADEPMPREYLKKLREDTGLTMQQVGDKIGISRQYYYMIERGLSQKDMDISLAVKLAEIFSVDIETVLEKERELVASRQQEPEPPVLETETNDTRREIALILAEALEVTAEYLRGIAREE